MNIDALKYMIEMLKGIKESGKKFDLREWVIMDKEQPVCGTSCCAMGYAALDPVFQLAGLNMFVVNLTDKPEDRKPILLKTTKDFNKVARKYINPYLTYDFTYKDGNTISGFEAAVQLFDFEHEETAEILFLFSSYDSPGNGSIDQVIERIELLIEKGEENFFNDYYGYND